MVILYESKGVGVMGVGVGVGGLFDEACPVSLNLFPGDGVVRVSKVLRSGCLSKKQNMMERERRGNCQISTIK